ncbi:MAG TPA: signal peptide peptidase SppA [Vitreimonas sp.]|uniref:signal peptide peptidase SppA n=1 Tax=Vitreimonas sp. TaxID=3069702 RepID=UPI002D3C40EC|nr:signal peptide peptidase SppA [Vitreimonas sp.]HYD86147.1 signal peptide peptidase SppA [Vitreimonas sp.]
MKQFLITVGGVLVGLVLFLFIGPILLFSMLAAMAAPPAQPSQMVLALDLREEMTDQRPSNPFAALGGSPALLEVLTKLDAARTDDRVKGLYIRANTGGMPAAQAEELRAALAAFRQSGKFVVAHLQNDNVRMGMPGYMAIADADEVWLQDASEFMPMGLSAEVTFLAGTLQRYHMQAQFERREDYKTAAHTLTQRTFTPEHRESMLSLMTGLYDTMLANIAADRGITPAAARTAIESTPFTAARARELSLVDQIGRPEEAERAALARAENAEIVDFAEYRAPTHNRGRVIAVVQGEGAIVSGVPEDGFFGEDSVMNSDRIAEALLEASEDEDVAAIVFRVSSPGGSVVASDQILAALRTAQERGKKIVVSMGDVAASGGYYVSAYADEIVANSGTITGSIGVIGGKLIIGPAFDHYLSTNTETITVGSPMVEMFTTERPFNQAEQAAFAGFIDRAYAQFVGLVAEGREMAPDRVRALAGGRVWTGQQALERGLVDRIGGFHVAVARARELAGIGADDRVQLRFYPAQENPFEALGALFGASSESAEALVRLNAVLSDPRTQRALAALREEDGSVRAESEAPRIR